MAAACMRISRLQWIVGLPLAVGLTVGATISLQAQAPKPVQAKPAAVPARSPLVLLEQTKAINEQIESQWKANKVTPAPLCSDYEFIRRASLDIIGRIARPDEIDRYMKDPPTVRRSMLIERLLGAEDSRSKIKYNDEYAGYWAGLWTNWLLTRSGHRTYHEQMAYWLQERFAKDDSFKEIAHDILTATGKSNDNGAVNFILAHMGEPIPPAKRGEEGRFDMVPITSRTTRLFLGLQTQCTQCHDHPFNSDWKQNHFWGVNAFLRQVDAPLGGPQPTNRRDMGGRPIELKDDPSFNNIGFVYYETRKAEILTTKPVFLNGSKIPAGSKNSRREMLAKFLTEDEYFAKAYVNRMWGQFFGRGMNEQPAVDDFGDHNKVVHKELLDKLSSDFAGSGRYRPKEVIRWICNSRPYQLACVSNPTNDKPELESLFSRKLLKAMTPEQLFESLMTATQYGTGDTQKKLREDWLRKLTLQFGDDEGNEITFNGTVVQALLLMNGDEINRAVKEGPTVKKAMESKTAKAIMDHVFLAALNRRVGDREYSMYMTKLGLTSGRKDKDPALMWQDLLWALLNSNEFALNH